MALYDDLKVLARLPAAESPFLSLHLNTCWGSEKERERVRIFVKTRVKECLAGGGSLSPQARQGLEEDAERVNHYVKGLVNREWDEAYNGVAVFACSALDVYTIVRSRIPFEDAFSCGDRPILRAVAEQAHEGEPALLAVVSADSGRLVELELGGRREEFAFQDEDFPGRHEQGGWSQARYQRHVEEHIHRNLKRLAGQLVRRADERRVQRIVLSGPAELLGLFEEHLPKRIRDALCARIHAEPKGSQDAILDETLTALRDAREREDRQAVDSLFERVAAGGRVAAGAEDVSKAVASGKVRTLFLDQAYETMGWKCFSCGALGVKVPLGCPVCKAGVKGVELAEELVRGTLAADGRLVPVADHEGLREWGVGALLRYA